MNQDIKNVPSRRPGKCMFLRDLDWQLAIERPEPHQSELPSIQCTAFAKQTMAACRRIFSSPSPILSRRPLPWNLFMTRFKSRSVESPNRSQSKIRLLCTLVKRRLHTKLVCLWCGRTGGRVYGHANTKIYGMDRLPNFLRYVAPFARAWSSAIILSSTMLLTLPYKIGRGKKMNIQPVSVKQYS